MIVALPSLLPVNFDLVNLRHVKLLIAGSLAARIARITARFATMQKRAGVRASIITRDLAVSAQNVFIGCEPL